MPEITRATLQPPADGPASLDNPLYYLRNFEWVLRWVLDRYHDLLPQRERSFIEAFMALPEPSRGLLTRMVMRKGDLFRPESLHYPELAEGAAGPLLSCGWLDPQPSVGLADIFRLCNWSTLKPALAPRLAEQGLVGSGVRKREALAALEAAEPPPATAEEWGLSADAIWRVTVMPQCDRLRWLFFGNAYQDWSEFVLTELGLFQYEPVVFDEGSRPVHTPAELDTYWQLMVCRERWNESEDPDDISKRLPETPRNNPWLERHYHRLLFKLGRHRERAGELEEAQDWYRQCRYPGARGRLLRVLERLEAYQPALSLAQQAQAAPESEAELQQVARTLPRLHRKLNLEKPPRPSQPRSPELHLTLPYSAWVEQAVAAAMATDDAPVYYAENTLITGLFGLLCWEAVFQPLPGAFFHPFQRGPADLNWPDFYQRRREAFDDCLARLDDGRYAEVIRRHYHQKWGRQSPFVAWGALTEELLETALACIPADHLKACFQRLLRDVKANRAGLPDLIQFWPAERRYRLVEVKGPGDRLQDNQRRWLAFFDRHDIPVSVCYVSWSESGADAVSGEGEQRD